jgi:putative aldouronate transport system permease protein
MGKRLLRNIPRNILLIFVCLLIVIPVLYIVSVSLSLDSDIVEHGYQLIPDHFSLAAYRYYLRVPAQIINAYLVSIAVTVMGTLFGLTLSTMLAYVMSRRDYKWRMAITRYTLIPLFFNAGVVPLYLIVTRVFHLGDTIWALFLPYGISVWFTFLMRGFMSDLPFELIESAKMDGANEYRAFFFIVVPIVKPALATIGLFYAFAYWNDWWLPMLFINRSNLIPLQFLLYRTLNNLDFILRNISMVANMNRVEIPGEATRMAVAVLAAAPMMIVFPFFQRFFVKGITMGSVKG